MTLPVRSHPLAGLLAVVLLAALAGCSVRTGSFGATGSGMPSVVPSGAAGTAVVLRFGDHVATGVLADTAESRQFASMLPATVNLRDVWGQAKSGRLPGVLAAAGGAPIHDPVPGDIYFWPTSDVLAIYYDDLGQAVPAPGLIRLGTLSSGLDELADAGRQLTVRIDLAAAG
jgi:hypothetical protein